MRFAIDRTRRGWVAAAAVLTVAVLAAEAPAAGQAGEGRLFVVVKVADNVLAEMPARASGVTAEGVLVDYAEALLYRAPNVQSYPLELPAGVYDVRVEGEGFVTEVKKGVPVFAGRDETVAVVVRPGQGVHIVEYAVAGLSREEVAARLARLEEETARLGAELAALRPLP